MKRRIISFLIATLILCSIFAGCGVSNSSTEPETTSATDASTIPNLDTMTFSEFKEMTSEQQMAVAESFETADEYAKWYNDKLNEHEANIGQQKDPTAATENIDTTGSTNATDATVQTELTDPTVDTEPDPITPEKPDVTTPITDEMTFLKYHSLSADEQKAFINSFDSIEAFVQWHTAARKAYEDSLIEIDDTPIDAEDVLDKIGGN